MAKQERAELVSKHRGSAEITGSRLLGEGFYDAVCYLVSSPSDPGPREPVPQLDWQHFHSAVKARIEYLAGLGYREGLRLGRSLRSAFAYLAWQLRRTPWF
jgi:hypothetical protein